MNTLNEWYKQNLVGFLAVFILVDNNNNYDDDDDEDDGYRLRHVFISLSISICLCFFCSFIFGKTMLCHLAPGNFILVSSMAMRLRIIQVQCAPGYFFNGWIFFFIFKIQPKSIIQYRFNLKKHRLVDKLYFNYLKWNNLFSWQRKQTKEIIWS